MIILAHRNINLHTKSIHGGLVHIATNQKKLVPDDVASSAGFEDLVKSGTITVLEGLPPESPITPLPAEPVSIGSEGLPPESPITPLPAEPVSIGSEGQEPREEDAEEIKEEE